MNDESRLRKLRGGWAIPGDLPTGPNGRALCRWCSLEVPRGRRTFCSDFCVNEWKLRTNPGYLREQTFARDRGICAACGTDTVAAFNHLKRSRGAARLRALSEWGLPSLNRKSLWDADHVTPVSEGGGACDLRNIRTLCLKCHRQATSDLRARSCARSK